MNRLVAVLLFVLGVEAGGLQAQVLPPRATSPSAEVPVIHVTDALMRQPEARAAMASFQARRTQHPPLLQSATAPSYRLNQAQTFKVRTFGSSTQFEEIEFTLKSETARFRIWVETAELVHIRAEDVEGLRATLQDATPVGSFNPDAGIIVNNETVFGNPPDPDQDGKSDVLWLDIRDDRQSGESFVAGFVDPLDLAGTQGNGRDILYLDTQPGFIGDDGERKAIDGIAATAAHEYQHLIRLGYDGDEVTFVDEGLSEWAELLNGYPGRSITYLGDDTRYNVALFRWLPTNDPMVLDDYQRAGLFTTYLAERIGRTATGAITRDPSNGLTGYRNAVNQSGTGVTVEDILSDFHIANFVNDPLADPFGYTTPQRAAVQATGTAVADGRTGTTETPYTEIDIEQGGTRYYTWAFVDDFTFTLDVPPSVDGDFATQPERRARLRVRAILEQDGTAEIRDVALGASVQTLSGSFDRLTLAVTHIDPNSRTTRVAYDAAWTNDSAFRVEPVVYDDGRVATDAEGNGIYSLIDDGEGYATRFSVPDGALLGTVRMPMYYLNEFGDPPDVPEDSAPRDFDLTIWDAAPDGTPGTILFTKLVTDTSSTQDVFTDETQIRYLDVDLTEALADVTLSEIIYIGARNDGDDTNHIVYSAADYSAENLTYLLNTSGTWRAAWEVTFTNGSSLREHVIPVRVEFLVPRSAVPVEEASELPQVAVLHPNYPNPFNPATTIRYELPQAADVRLTVYDVLGRTVATLIDGREQAGAHTVQVDASGWASGVYLYVLDTGAHRLTRRMLLVK